MLALPRHQLELPIPINACVIMELKGSDPYDGVDGSKANR
jgi:hypothetical protein